MTYKAQDFISWALTHAAGGAEPWHYLFGSVKTQTTAAKLEERYKNYYSSHGWTRAQYDAATKGWKATDYATDCQGLLDAYLTERGEKTDINADMNYKNWCTDKGTLKAVGRPFVIGEALFMARANGTMHHVGWICGFDTDGEPLAVEARGLAYGVVVTRLKDRPWTHRGLMTAKFSYDNNVEENKPMAQTVFEKTSPMKTGNAFKAMQTALNEAGYTDAKGRKLTEDGKWGENSQVAFNKLINAHASSVDKPEDDSAVYLTTEDGKYELKLTVSEG